ncbi:ribbon-helix-helix protein, CopG family, partial [Weissella cibaria]|uniref:ribbon-helix-helix protein, CopG family n=1 Tax=Weissella cibaria TaxID=137591 RepID=UPI00143F3045
MKPDIKTYFEALGAVASVVEPKEPVSKTVPVTVRLPREALAEIDALVAAAGISSRQILLRRLVLSALSEA